MNPHDHDHPDLTSYALGELAPAEAEAVRKWLTQSPEARAEFERIRQTIGLLQDAPALPKRALLPRQRETVLALGQVPAARAKHAVPYLAYRRPAGSGTSRPNLAWRFLEFAAAACLVAGAFMLGQRSTHRITGLTGAPGHATPDIAEVPSAPVDAPEVAAAPAITVVPTVAEPEIRSKAAAPSSPVVAKAATPAAKAAGPKSPAAQPTASKPAAQVAEVKRPAPAVAASSGAPPSLRGFEQATASSHAVLALHPKAIRPLRLPVPDEFAGVVLASPRALDPKPAAPARKPEAQPPLVIHSWKAEIASCPWDPSRRLMRFVAQIPVAQPGIADSESDYKLVAKFDPFQVQGFRLVTEKHMRPTPAGTLATRFAWYEIIPTRNFNAAPDKPATIGTITIEQPRGAASESSQLKLVDRGLSWSDAREDFGFETAMIGWNMLLQGSENVGSLNSRLVLDLAEKTRGEDAKGERARFINIVKQAQRAVGM